MASPVIPLFLDIARSALIPTRLLLGAWATVSTMEWWTNFDLFDSRNLLSWDVMSLRAGWLFKSRVSRVAFSNSSLRVALSARLAAIIVLFATSDLVAMSLALIAIVFSSWLILVRSGVGNDGSDQMGYIVALGTLVTVFGLMAKDTWIVFSGTLGIAGQLTISYFIAGFSKTLSPIWRSGAALSGVMNTYSYGHAGAAKLATNYPSFSLILCWVIMLSEALFPIALLLPLPILLTALVMFFIVHWINAFFMGLNAFPWAFASAYPSVILISIVLRARLGLT